MQRCPREITDLILDKMTHPLQRARFASPGQAYISFLTTWTSVCRAMAYSARPRLFAYAWLGRPSKCATLLELIAMDSDIAGWVQRVTVSDMDHFRHTKNSHATTAWLFARPGQSLLGMLTAVKELEISEVKLTSPDVFNGAVNALGHLHNISSLQLLRTRFSSTNHVISFYQMFQHLVHLSLGDLGETAFLPRGQYIYPSHEIRSLQALDVGNSDAHTLNMILGVLPSMRMHHLRLLSCDVNNLISEYRSIFSIVSKHVVKLSLVYRDRYGWGPRRDLDLRVGSGKLDIRSMPALRSLELDDVSEWHSDWICKMITYLNDLVALDELHLKWHSPWGMKSSRNAERWKNMDNALSNLSLRFDQNINIYLHFPSWAQGQSIAVAWDEILAAGLPKSLGCASLVVICSPYEEGGGPSCLIHGRETTPRKQELAQAEEQNPLQPSVEKDLPVKRSFIHWLRPFRSIWLRN